MFRHQVCCFTHQQSQPACVFLLTSLMLASPCSKPIRCGCRCGMQARSESLRPRTRKCTARALACVGLCHVCASTYSSALNETLAHVASPRSGLVVCTECHSHRCAERLGCGHKLTALVHERCFVVHSQEERSSSMTCKTGRRN